MALFYIDKNNFNVITILWCYYSPFFIKKFNIFFIIFKNDLNTPPLIAELISFFEFFSINFQRSSDFNRSDFIERISGNVENKI